MNISYPHVINVVKNIQNGKQYVNVDNNIVVET